MKSIYRNLTTRQLLVLGVAVPLFCTLVIAWLQWTSVEDLLKSRDLVRHSRTIQLDLSIFRYSLSDAESCQFRYVLTHDSTDLDRYHTLIATTQDLLAQLKTLTADNSVQSKYLSDMMTLVGTKLKVTDQSFLEEQNGNHAGALQIISDDQTRRNILDIEATMEKMQATEGGILFDRQNTYQRRFKINAMLSGLGMLLSLGFIVGILLLLKRLSRLQSAVTLSALSEMMDHEGGLLTTEEYLKRRRDALDKHGDAQVEAERILGLLGKKNLVPRPGPTT